MSEILELLFSIAFFAYYCWKDLWEDFVVVFSLFNYMVIVFWGFQEGFVVQ